MGIMVYSLLWVMQDFVHQPYGFSVDKARQGTPFLSFEGQERRSLGMSHHQAGLQYHAFFLPIGLGFTV